MITVGCDPEVFLKSNGSIVSSIGLVGGSKRKPRPVIEGSVQEDNVLAEINIDPANDSSTFVSRINKVLDQLVQLSGCDLEIKSSHVFDKEYLKSVGPKAFSLGCEPDYNVYTGKANPRVNPYTCLRTAGGHIHVGDDSIDCNRLVRTMDLYLGVDSVLLDNDNERRALYGKAGSYRPKPYGLEYRVLGNFWLKSDELKRWVYDTTISAVNDHKHIVLPDDSLIQRCINTSDTGLANELKKEYSLCAA